MRYSTIKYASNGVSVKILLSKECGYEAVIRAVDDNVQYIPRLFLQISSDVIQFAIESILDECEKVIYTLHCRDSVNRYHELKSNPSIAKPFMIGIACSELMDKVNEIICDEKSITVLALIIQTCT